VLVNSLPALFHLAEVILYGLIYELDCTIVPRDDWLGLTPLDSPGTFSQKGFDRVESLGHNGRRAVGIAEGLIVTHSLLLG
jgi:hypothetical protein